MTAPTPNAPTAALSTDDAIARRIAVRAVQSLADSLPDEDTVEAQDRLKGTPQESMFVVSAEALEELIAVAISNAMYDGELAARQSPPTRDFRGYFAGINAADGMSTPAAEREGEGLTAAELSAIEAQFKLRDAINAMGVEIEQRGSRIAESDAALLAARRENETAWLIEVPQSGGAVWWTGQEDSDGNLPDSSRLAWLKFFSADANKAVRFRSEADAQAVLRLLPQSWKLWTYPAVVTDHRWCSGPDLAALAATPEGP